jgi:cell division protein FtsQ
MRWLRWLALGCGAAVITVFLGCVFIFCYDFVTQTGYYSARTVTVEGNRLLAREDILKTAGVEEGMNIYLASMLTFQARLARHPWIVSASVRRIPPGEIYIHVTERVPLAILDMERRYIMDENGVVFKAWEPGDPKELPVVLGLQMTDVQIEGEPLKGPYKTVYSFLRECRDNRELAASNSVTYVQVDRELGLTLYASDPPVAVRIGVDGFTGKLKRLQYVLYNLNRKEGIQASVIDLSDVDRVVVKPSGGTGDGTPADKSHKEV